MKNVGFCYLLLMPIMHFIFFAFAFVSAFSHRSPYQESTDSTTKGRTRRQMKFTHLFGHQVLLDWMVSASKAIDAMSLIVSIFVQLYYCYLL